MKAIRLIWASLLVLIMPAVLAGCAPSIEVRPGEGGLEKLPRLEIPKPGHPTPTNVEYTVEAIPRVSSAAMVYRFKTPEVSEELANQLAQSFNLKGSVQFEPRHQVYSIREGSRLFWIEAKTGKWSYQDNTNPGHPEKLPSSDEAKRLALDFLARLGFSPERFQVTVTSLTESTGPGKPEVPLARVVYFYPRLDGQAILGVSRIVVTIGDNGTIVGVNKFCKEIEPYKLYPLKRWEEALEEMKQGKGSNNLHPLATKATITEVQLRYWEDPGPVSEQPFLQPVYVFRGYTLINGKKESFDCVIPATDET